MARFTTRVELVDGEGLYTALHNEMEDRGFNRTIKADKTGDEFHLPEAEYNIIGDFTQQQVLNKAKDAVAAIDCEGRILVTESAGRIWHNLDEI